MTHVDEIHRDMVATALATMWRAEDDYVLGNISRRQFDAIAGSNVMILAGAAERHLRQQEASDAT